MSVCDDILEKLTDYHFGELSEAGRDQVKQHLDGCSTCRDQYQEVQAVIDHLEAAFSDLPEAPKVLSEDRVARILATETEAPQPIAFPKSILISMAACITVVLVVTFAVALQRPKDPEFVAIIDSDPLKVEGEDKKLAVEAEEVGKHRDAGPSPEEVEARAQDMEEKKAKAGKRGSPSVGMNKGPEAEGAGALMEDIKRPAMKPTRPAITRGAPTDPSATFREPSPVAPSKKQRLPEAIEAPTVRKKDDKLKKTEQERAARTGGEALQAPKEVDAADDAADDEMGLDDANAKSKSPKARVVAPPGPLKDVEEAKVHEAQALAKLKEAQDWAERDADKSLGHADMKSSRSTQSAALKWGNAAQKALARNGRTANLVVVLAPGQRRREMAPQQQADFSKLALSKSSAPTHQDPDTLLLIAGEARKSGMTLTPAGAGLILRPAPMSTKSISATPEAQNRALALRRQLIATGNAMPDISVDPARKKMKIVGSKKEISDFDEVLQVADMRKRMVALSAEGIAGAKPKRAKGMASGGKDKASKMDSLPAINSSVYKKKEPGRSVRDEAETTLPKLEMAEIRGDQALQTFGRFGKIKIRNEAGEINTRLGIYTNKLTAREGIALVCRALDMNVTFAGQEAIITPGPHRADLATVVFQLTKAQAHTLGIVDSDTSAAAKTALEKKGVSLSSGSALNYDPKSQVLVIRGEMMDLQRVKELLK